MKPTNTSLTCILTSVATILTALPTLAQPETASPVAVVASGNHSLMLYDNGELWSPERDAECQLGQDNTAFARPQPVLVASDVSTPPGSVAAGLYHTVFVKNTGLIFGTGRNESSQVGWGNPKWTPALIASTPSNFIAIAAGGYHTLFLADDGTLWATGDKAYGSLGTGAAATLTVNSLPPSITTQPAACVAPAGGMARLSVETDGSGLSYQWYFNGTLIEGATSATLDIPAATAADAGSYTVTVTNAAGSATSDPVAITVGSGFVTEISANVFRTDDGAAWQLGTIGYAQDISSAQVPLHLMDGVRSISGGAYIALFVKDDGALWGLGGNGYNQCGLGMGVTSPVHYSPGAATSVAAISAGRGYHSLFLKSDGTLWAFGEHNYVSLDGTQRAPGDCDTPVKIAENVATFATGAESCIFLKNDGTLWGVGSNSRGQLGVPVHGGDNWEQDIYNTPFRINITDVAAIAAGYLHHLILKKDGSLWTLGSNDLGQLGVAPSGVWENDFRHTLGMVDTGVALIAAGDAHSLYVKNDGTLWAFGNNENGQLATPTASTPSGCHHTPVQIAAGIIAVAAGRQHSAYVTNEGKLYAVGSNAGHQLGAGVPGGYGQYSSTPVQLTGGGAGPVIIRQPASQSVVASPAAGVSFGVIAGGAQPLTYQWKKNGADFVGATNATLTLDGIAAADAGNYTVTVTNAGGASVTSAPATLAVSAPPEITTQPQSQTAKLGDTVIFTVAVTGQGPIFYQWYYDSDPILGATSPTLTLQNVTPASAGNYWVCVSNAIGTVNSANATLAAILPPAITAQPQAQTVIAGQNATFSVAATGGNLSYQWRRDGSTISGAISASYTLANATLADNGAVFTVVVANTVDTVTSAPATLTVNASSLQLAQQFKTQVETPGADTVTITGIIDLSLVGGATIASGKTLVGADANAMLSEGTLTIPPGASDIVILGVTFSGGSLTLNGATDVKITHCDFDAWPVTVTGGSDNVTFSWNRFMSGSPLNSVMRVENSGAAIGIILHHNNFSGEALRADMPGAANARIHMFNNTHLHGDMNANALVAGAGAQILAIGSYFEQVLNPLTRQAGGLIRAFDSFSVNTIGATESDDQGVFVPRYSYVVDSIAVASGGTVPAFASLVSHHAGNTAGADSVTPATVAAGGEAGITVAADATATGAGARAPLGATVTLAATRVLNGAPVPVAPANCRWYFKHGAIPGATAPAQGATLQLASITAAHAGDYYVELLVEDGAMYSGAFTLEVGDAPAPPIITKQPDSRTITTGQSATFTVTATGENLAYQWRRNGTNIPGASSASYTLSNATLADNGAVFTVVVTNSDGDATSDSATLTVNNNNNGNNNGGGGGALTPPTLALLAALIALRSRKTNRPNGALKPEPR